MATSPPFALHRRHSHYTTRLLLANRDFRTTERDERSTGKANMSSFVGVLAIPTFASME
jgi:hypothetical protein